MIRPRIGRLGSALLAAGLLACAPAEPEAPGGGTPAERPPPPPPSAPATPPPPPAAVPAADSVPVGRLRDSVRAGPIFEVPAVDDSAAAPRDTPGGERP